jgi:hypothetical protein
VNGDAALVQERLHGRARSEPEELQRLVLGRDERELDVAKSSRGQMVGRQQGELVDRQRPHRSPWDDERDLPHLAVLGFVEQSSHLPDVGRASEGERARDRRNGHRSAGEEKHVVRVSCAGRGLRHVTTGVDRSHGPRDERRADRGSELRQLEVSGLAEPKRLGDCERAVPEVRLGGEQLDGDSILGERSQRERRLEGGHPAACDKDGDRLGAIHVAHSYLSASAGRMRDARTAGPSVVASETM